MSEQCSHGQITVHPSSNPHYRGYAFCEVCRTSLTDHRALEEELVTAKAELARVSEERDLLEAQRLRRQREHEATQRVPAKAGAERPSVRPLVAPSPDLQARNKELEAALAAATEEGFRNAENALTLFVRNQALEAALRRIKDTAVMSDSMNAWQQCIREAHRVLEAGEG